MYRQFSCRSQININVNRSLLIPKFVEILLLFVIENDYSDANLVNVNIIHDDYVYHDKGDSNTETLAGHDGQTDGRTYAHSYTALI